MTMITPSYLGETIEYSSLHACRSTLEDPTHVLTPVVMELLNDELAQAGTRGVPLSAALAKLAGRGRYLASELSGRRYDIGVKYGLLTAQVALALDGRDRDEVMSGLLELLARRELR